MNEAKTRQEIIDKRLARAGWLVDHPGMVTQEFDIFLGPDAVKETQSPYGGHQFSDYVLLKKDSTPQAVVEAKKTSRDAQLGQEQALQYAQNIQKTQGGDLPFIFYTNGHDIFFWDSENYPPQKVYGFPTRDDLEHMEFRRKEKRPLSPELINSDIAGRSYQIEAIRTILERIEQSRRKMLLVMATGTGKTRTAIALIDVLMRARRVKRVAFLVDRIALRNQALDACKEHLPNAPVWPQLGETDFATDRRIYCTTYQTMLNIIEKEDGPSPFFFDLIIADESHRSIYNIYQNVLSYFHALQLGLTATPTDRIDHDTFDIFTCETGVPDFAYSYDEAVNHIPPYLCDFEVLKVRSKFQLEGIQGECLPQAAQKKLIAEGRDPSEIDFEGTDLERKVTNSGTNSLIVREFMEESIKDPNGVLPGKTIFFAISKAHAYRLQELFDAMYPEYKGNLARVIVSDDSRVHGKGGLLDQFKNNNMPRVAISVDMLDTGIDVREITNLVFSKPVFSYTKFWQMIGRGTRVLEDNPAKRKKWCPEKDKFLIIDCWGNFDFFKMEPRGREPGAQVALPVRLFESRLDKLEAAIAAGRTDLIPSITATLRADLAGLPQKNIVVMDHKADLDKTADDNFWHRPDAEKIGFLRSHIAPILRTRSGIDFKAMRFEKDVIDLSTEWLTENHDAFEAIKASLLVQIGELPLTVNVVAKEEAFILDVQREAWWTTPDEEKFQQLIDRLAPLMQYRQRKKTGLVKLTLEDLVAVKEIVEFGPGHERLTTAEYRRRIEERIQQLLDRSPVLQKIRDGEPISIHETLALAEQLESEDPYITEKLLQRIYDNKKAHFIDFIRHILGIQNLSTWTVEVEQAFEEFIARHNDFTALQIQFIQTLKTFILHAGHFQKQDLIQPPFTNLHPQGIRGIFQTSEVEEIVGLAARLVA
jgi:type I restriction enzyme R subunit